MDCSKDFAVSLLLMITCLPFLCAQITHHVKPSPDTPCPHGTCHTLSEYMNEADQYFTSNATLAFLPGDHIMEGTLTVTNIASIAFRGSTNSSSMAASRIVCIGPASFLFTNIERVEIEFLSFVSCGSIPTALFSVHCELSPSTCFSGAICISFVTEFKFTNCSITNGYLGLFTFGSQVIIKDSSFINNTADCGGGISVHYSHVRLVGENSFVRNTATDNGGGIYAELCFIESTGSVVFINNSAKSRGGGIHALKSTTTLGGNSSFVNNQAERSGGGIYIEYSYLLILNGNTRFVDNVARYDGGGISAHSASIVKFEGECAFVHNSATHEGGGVAVSYSATVVLNKNGSLTFTYNSALYGGGIYVAFGSTSVLYGSSTFIDNSGTYGAAAAAFETSNMTFKGYSTFAQNSAFHGGAIFLHHNAWLVLSGNCTFDNNSASIDSGYGGGIYAFRSIVTFNGSQLFRNNSAAYGGGLAITDRDKTKLQLLPHSVAHFVRNYAKRGGAIFVKDNPFTGCFSLGFPGINFEATCFLEFELNERLSPKCTSDPYLLAFIANYAEEAGNALYGGSIHDCSTKVTCVNVTSLVYRGFDEYAYISDGPNTTSDISSDPFLVSRCSLPKNDLAYDLYPGETLQVSVIAVGQLFEPVPGVVRVRFDTAGGNLKLGNLQTTQVVGKTCTPVHYTFFSKDLGIASEISLSVVVEGPCSDLGRALSVHVKLHSCPVAFALSVEGGCVCEKRLQRYTNSCNIDNESIQGNGEFWVGLDIIDASRNSSGLILHPHCPFDYCRSQPVNFTMDSQDLQCASKRSGILCGACQPGHSLALGSSQCLKCSNKYLPLILIFIVAGFALVVLLFTCKITVAAGTISGLIFYVNVIAVNRARFFPPEETNILTVFIAWLNLDLGIETCLCEGMDAYIKTWLQFAFPIYIWILVGLIAYVSNYSTTIARVLGPTNPVAVLATLFLLSYTKLLRTIIAVFSFTTLDYPNDKFVAVWVYDGNIGYLRGKQIALFLAGLLAFVLLFLPYTLLLVLGQWIQSKSELRLLSWANNSKFRAFFDAYYAPYKNRHRYWVGLLLLLRFILFIVLAVIDITSPRDPSVNLLTIIASCVGLQTWVWNTGGMYKKWYLNALESSFILNLVMLAAATYHERLTGGNQAAVIYLSLSVAFATFNGIITYHVCQRVTESQAWRNSILPKLHRLRLRVINGRQEDEEPTAIELQGSFSPPHAANRVVPTTFIDLRESLLDSNS